MALEIDRRTAEFKSAVAEAANAKTAELAAQVEELKALVEKKAESVGAAPADLKAIMEHLGMTLADISAQGIGVQKPVAPEVLRAREEAHKRMIERIKRAKHEGFVPLYKVIATTQAKFGKKGEGLVHPFWVDSDKVRQATEIEWPGVPNMALQPINDVAKEIMALFKDSNGNMGRSAPVELEDVGYAKINGGPGRKEKRDAPGEFDVSPDDDGVRVLHRGGRGQARRVNVIGSIAEPAEVSG